MSSLVTFSRNCGLMVVDDQILPKMILPLSSLTTLLLAISQVGAVDTKIQIFEGASPSLSRPHSVPLPA